MGVGSAIMEELAVDKRLGFFVNQTSGTAQGRAIPSPTLLIPSFAPVTRSEYRQRCPRTAALPAFRFRRGIKRTFIAARHNETRFHA